MRKKQMRYRRFLSLLLAILLMTAYVIPAYAEEDGGYEDNYEEEEQEEETEFIPDEYYDSIESNELPGWPKGEAVQAASAVVMDLDTNTFLYSKNMYAKMYPASITKIMTAMIALEQGNLDEEIEFSEIVYDLEYNSSNVGIQPEEKLTLRQALYALMLESANDVANGLAEYFGGSMSGFADLMNAKAKELGCVNTHFSNPSGLHNDDHYTCAYDMALIAQAAYEIPQFREFASTTLYECASTNLTEEERYFVNHHKMLQQESEYYYAWCTAGKTGFTSDAWNTLVTYSEKDGMRLVCVLLHENGAGRAYNETAMLLNYGFDNFQEVSMTEEEVQPTFYEVMKLDGLDRVSQLFQVEALKEPIGEMMPGVVTIPDIMKVDDLTAKSEKTGELTGAIFYSYHEWPVGMAGFQIHPLVPITAPSYQQKRDMEEILNRTAAVRKRSEIEETAEAVMQNTEVFVKTTYEKAKDFVEKNTLTVIWVGSFILLVLLIIIIILILRCTKEYRIKKRRLQEERELLKKEEEIDRMTTSEIEQELREAMEQERLLKEKKIALQEEQRRQEEKLRETEKILEEINNSQE